MDRSILPLREHHVYELASALELLREGLIVSPWPPVTQ